MSNAPVNNSEIKWFSFLGTCPVNLKRNFHPGVSSALSTEQSDNDLMKHVPNGREERKTASEWDPRGPQDP